MVFEKKHPLITFTINGEMNECVNLNPIKCQLLYEGNRNKYYLLVDRSLYKAKDHCGVFHFEYIKEINVEL